MSYSYLLFDLDGTLTDPAEGIFNSIIYSLKRFGIDKPEEEVLRKFIGPPLIDSFSEYFGFSEEKSNEAIKFYREYFSVKGKFENKLYPGVAEFLSEMKKRGKTLLVATSKPEPFAKDILEHFNLSQYFDVIAGCDLNDNKSTKGKVISESLRRGNVTDKTKAVMIGDRKHDVIGAAENGLPTIGVLYGYGSKEELLEAGAVATAGNFEELKGCLYGWSSA